MAKITVTIKLAEVDELKELIEAANDIVKRSVPVIVGVRDGGTHAIPSTTIRRLREALNALRDKK